MKVGWQRRRFGDVCDLKKGKKPTLLTSCTEGVKPYLIAKYLRGAEPAEFASVNDRNSVLVSKEDLIIICDGSNSGETFLGFDGVLSSTMAKIGHGKDITNRFLMHFLDSLFEKFNAGKTGAAIPHLDLAALREETLPLPPVEEQQRVVAILDEAFDGIAAARANSEQNLQNARAIFESHLQAVFSQGCEGWIEKSVGELVAEGLLAKPFDGNHGEIHPKKSDYTESGTPFIMARDLHNGHVDTKSCTFISRSLADSLRVGFAKDGDVLISHKGTIGRSAIVSTDNDYIMLTPQVTSYRVSDATKLLNRFIYYYFISPNFQRDMVAGAADGSTRAYIGITRQLRLRFRFPALAQQKRIAAELDVLEPETRRLSTLYQRKIDALDELKKSLLNQAFSGNL